MKINDLNIYRDEKVEIILDSYDKIDDIALKMIGMANLANIIPFNFSIDGDRKVLSYNLKGYDRINLKILDEETIDSLIRSLLKCKDQVLKNLMDFNNLFFSNLYIFERDSEFSFIYLPLVESQFNNDLTRFIKSILLEGKFRKDYSKEYILKLIELIDLGVNERNFNKLFAEKNTGLSLREDPPIYINEPIDVEIPSSPETDRKVSNIIKKLISTFNWKENIREKAKNIYLFEDKSRIDIKNFIKLGSDSNLVDYVIGDGSVEDFHCIIGLEKGFLYIEDNNTLSGTYVNKKKLLPRVQVNLYVGDEVGFGNKRTIFIAK